MNDAIPPNNNEKNNYINRESPSNGLNHLSLSKLKITPLNINDNDIIKSLRSAIKKSLNGINQTHTTITTSLISPSGKLSDGLNVEYIQKELPLIKQKAKVNSALLNDTLILPEHLDAPIWIPRKQRSDSTDSESLNSKLGSVIPIVYLSNSMSPNSNTSAPFVSLSSPSKVCRRISIYGNDLSPTNSPPPSPPSIANRKSILSPEPKSIDRERKVSFSKQVLLVPIPPAKSKDYMVSAPIVTKLFDNIHSPPQQSTNLEALDSISEERLDLSSNKTKIFAPPLTMDNVMELDQYIAIQKKRISTANCIVS